MSAGSQGSQPTVVNRDRKYASIPGFLLHRRLRTCLSHTSSIRALRRRLRGGDDHVQPLGGRGDVPAHLRDAVVGGTRRHPRRGTRHGASLAGSTGPPLLIAARGCDAGAPARCVADVAGGGHPVCKRAHRPHLRRLGSLGRCLATRCTWRACVQRGDEAGYCAHWPRRRASVGAHGKWRTDAAAELARHSDVVRERRRRAQPRLAGGHSR
mmetsp:Transcript_23496/g.71905  ORF Transcript_23496/g.71905 Transcript_23496/m.71905 type:complete len:211 (+) Transcript_23496:445-1077(+)